MVIVMTNKLVSQHCKMNDNSVINFSGLHKNIINIMKYIAANNKYQITKIK